MWIPGFAFCKGCCPEAKCPACLAGGATRSCVRLTVSGVTGSSTLDDCTWDASKYNGEWLLCFWGATSLGDFPCSWQSIYDLCSPGCATNWNAHGRLQVTGSGSTYTILASLRVRLGGGTQETLSFKLQTSEPPNCYFKDRELPYSAADSSSLGCDFSGATCVINYEQTQRCYFDQSSSGNDCSFQNCDREKVPWQGVRVELSGFENGDCDQCHWLNGTYILSGPPGKDAAVVSGSASGMARGWRLPIHEVGCSGDFGGSEGRIYDEMLVPVDGGHPGQGFAAIVHNSAGFSDPNQAPIVFSTGSCDCLAGGEDLDPTIGFDWPGCTVGKATITPIT